MERWVKRMTAKLSFLSAAAAAILAGGLVTATSAPASEPQPLAPRAAGLHVQKGALPGRHGRLLAKFERSFSIPAPRSAGLRNSKAAPAALVYCTGTVSVFGDVGVPTSILYAHANAHCNGYVVQLIEIDVGLSENGEFVAETIDNRRNTAAFEARTRIVSCRTGRQYQGAAQVGIIVDSSNPNPIFLRGVTNIITPC